MSVTNVTSKAVYTANGTQKDFPFAGRILDADYLKVYVGSELKTIATDYSVIGDSNGSLDGAGTVRFVTAPAADSKVVILRELPIKQESAYPTNGNIPSKTLELDLDKSALIDQQLSEKLDRALKVPVESDDTPEELMEDLFDARDAAEAAQTAAEAAQTGAETAQTAAETAKTGAETAQTAAETAKTAAETAATNAAASATAAETAATNAAVSATAAAQSATDAAASAAASAASESESSATAAAASANAAAQSATDAATAKTGAETARTGAEAAQTAAETAADSAAASALASQNQSIPATALTDVGKHLAVEVNLGTATRDANVLKISGIPDDASLVFTRLSGSWGIAPCTAGDLDSPLNGDYVLSVAGDRKHFVKGYNTLYDCGNGTYQMLRSAVDSVFRVFTLSSLTDTTWIDGASASQPILIQTKTTKTAWNEVTMIPDANTSTKGIVQIATSDEAKCGTDTTKAVTSKALADTLDAEANTTYYTHQSGVSAISSTQTKPNVWINQEVAPSFFYDPVAQKIFLYNWQRTWENGSAYGEMLCTSATNSINLEQTRGAIACGAPSFFIYYHSDLYHMAQVSLPYNRWARLCYQEGYSIYEDSVCSLLPYITEDGHIAVLTRRAYVNPTIEDTFTTTLSTRVVSGVKKITAIRLAQNTDFCFCFYVLCDSGLIKCCVSLNSETLAATISTEVAPAGSYEDITRHSTGTISSGGLATDINGYYISEGKLYRHVYSADALAGVQCGTGTDWTQISGWSHDDATSSNYDAWAFGLQLGGHLYYMQYNTVTALDATNYYTKVQAADSLLIEAVGCYDDAKTNPKLGLLCAALRTSGQLVRYYGTTALVIDSNVRDFYLSPGPGGSILAIYLKEDGSIWKHYLTTTVLTNVQIQFDGAANTMYNSVVEKFPEESVDALIPRMPMCLDYNQNTVSGTETFALLTSKRVERDMVVSSWRSEDGFTWYRKWKSGFIEQGGRCAMLGNMSVCYFPTKFATNTYFVAGTYDRTGLGTSSAGSYAVTISVKETDNFKFNMNYANASAQAPINDATMSQAMLWYASGY